MTKQTAATLILTQEATAETQPSLFTDVGLGLVPSEAALVNSDDYSLEIVRLARQKAEQTTQPRPKSRLDETIERRRATIAWEREEFLASPGAEVATSVDVTQVTTNVVPLALQATLALEYPKTENPEGKLVAFGRYLKDEFYNIAGEFSPEILLDSEREIMAPVNIAPQLFRSRKARSSTEGMLYVDDILLNQVEYRLLPRAPKALARASFARTLGDLDIGEDNQVINRADRSVGHTFEVKVDDLTSHRDKLTERIEELEELKALARTPGYAHVTPEKMKSLISAAFKEFDNLVHVLAVANKWNGEERQVAKTSLLCYLTTGRQNVRVAHFNDMLRFVIRYAKARQNLCNNRLTASQEFLPLATTGIEQNDQTA